MIRVACIGLPSVALPALGVPGVAVYPFNNATGHGATVVRALRRQLSWWHALRSLHDAEHLVLCNPPSWAHRVAVTPRRATKRVTTVVANDAKDALREAERLAATTPRR